MRKLLILIFICFGLDGITFSAPRINNITQSCDTLPTQQLINYLQQMNVQSYYGTPVDSFLSAIPANFYNMKIYSSAASKPPRLKASYLVVNFTDSYYGPTVKIYVTDYTHMNKYSPNGTWDINLFRQENIDRIEVWRDQNTCINGDCMH